MKFRLFLFTFCFWLLFISDVHAGLYSFTSRISGVDSSVVLGNLNAESTVSASLLGGGTTYRRFGYVSFGVDLHHSLVIGSGEVELTVRVERWLGVTYLGDTVLTQTVSGSKSMSSVYLEGMDKYRVKLEGIKVNGVSVQELPDYVYIDLNLYLEHYFSYATASTPIAIDSVVAVDTDCDGVVDVLRVYWPVSAGEEEYQFEWSFVNDYGQSTGTYLPSSSLTVDFKNNSTRVSLFRNYYDISLIYDHGYVVYRVRGLGRDLSGGASNLDKIIYGVWSSADKSLVSSLPALSSYHQTTGYEKGLNWQYSASFAEEGKSKEVISFADGTLRSRQMVTRMNTDGQIIVGETVYDYQGRAAVQILPVPVAPSPCGGNQAASLKYYRNFNLSGADKTKFTAAHFDKDPEETEGCVSSGDSLSTLSGASKYYSPQNWDKDKENGYIADGEGYPYMRTEYTPDNTGRVRRQSGVGEQYRLDGGKETKFYYGAADDMPLRRLFGNETGYSSYYEKQMVIDAGGQVSVSYTDNLDRVVATALAGDAPPNVAALPESSGSGDSLSTELFLKDVLTGEDLSNKLSASGDSKVFEQTFLVSSSGYYTFDYNLLFSNFKDSCLSEDVCFDCVYDFSMRLEDECGADLLADLNLNRMLGHFERDSLGAIVLSTACMSTDSVLNHHFTLYLPVGSYTLSKRLQVNKEAKYAYLQKYLDTVYNGCVKTLDDFISEYGDDVDYSGCADVVDCDSCLVLLGSLEDYLSGGGTAEDYYLREGECRALCQTYSYCDVQRELMLSDMRAGGQYAEYSQVGGQVSVITYPLSVFNTANKFSKADADWKHPKIKLGQGWVSGYYESDSVTRSKIELQVTLSGGAIVWSVPMVDNLNTILQQTEAGQTVYYAYPEDLKEVGDFIAYYQTNAQWAASLLYYHPEYGFYRSCEDFQRPVVAGEDYSSEGFDALLQRTDTWKKAVERGLIKTNYASVPVAGDRVEDWFTASASHAWDPFVVHGLSGSDLFWPFGAVFKNRYQLYVDTLSRQLSMVELASVLTRCPSSLSLSGVPPCVGDFGLDAQPGNTYYNDSIRNAEWITLRQLYLSEKQLQTYNLSANKTVHELNAEYLGYNGCISNVGFDHGAYGFWMLSNMSGQPCAAQTGFLYQHKQLRFGKVTDFFSPQGVQNTATANYYAQTGLCPTAVSLQMLLEDIVRHGGLDVSQSGIESYGAYSGYFLALKDYDWTGAVPAASYQVGPVTSGHLSAAVNTGTQTLDVLTLDKFPGATFAFSDITKITHLKPGSLWYVNGEKGYGFTLYVQRTESGQSVLDSLKGRTLMNIKTCPLEPVCEKSTFLVSMQNLLGALSLSGDLISMTPLQIVGGTTATDYTPYVNSLVRQKMGNSQASTAWWQLEIQNGVGYYTLKENPSSPAYLTLRVLYSSPLNYAPSGTPVLGQIHLKGEHYFSIDVLNATTHQKEAEYYCMFTYHSVSGTETPVNVGQCTDIQASGCSSTAVLNYKQFNSLLKTSILEQKLTSAGLNLFAGLQANGEGECILDYSQSSTHSSFFADTLSEGSADSVRYTLSIDSGVRCPVVLQYERIAGSYFNSDSIAIVQDLILLGDVAPDGSSLEFKIPFAMSSGSGLVWDTLRGYTMCLPLQVCLSCLDTIYSGDGFCEDMYMDYLAAYGDYIGAQKVLHCTDYETLLPVLSYGDFTARNLCCSDNLRAYRQLLSSQPESCKQDVSTLFADCGIAYDTLSDCKQSYYRYIKALAQAGGSAWGASHNKFQEVEFPDYDSFLSAGYCYCVTPYVAYLESYITASASDVLDDPLALSDYCPGPLAEGADTCGLAYKQYMKLYYRFAAYTIDNSTCSNFHQTVPLLSYGDFTGRGLCCSMDSLLVASAWLITAFDTLSCPTGQLPYYGSCTQDFSSSSWCVENYSKYVNAVLSYNASAWRAANSEPEILLESYDNLQATDKCFCIGIFAGKLQPYIDAGASDVLPSPPSLKGFAYCNAEVGEYEEPCKKMYGSYVENYMMMVEDSVCGITPPVLYSYSDFISHGICCSADTMFYVYQTFVSAFDDPVSCPSVTLPTFQSCDTSLSDSCVDRLAALINGINAYNNSAYAGQHGTLAYPSGNFMRGVAGVESPQPFGKGIGIMAEAPANPTVDCDCLPTYIAYLDSFAHLSPSAGTQLPKTVYTFRGCPKASSDMDSICADSYEIYVHITEQYNDSIAANGYGSPVRVLSAKDFKAKGLCQCAQDYTLYLADSVMEVASGKSTFVKPQSLERFCKEPAYVVMPCGPSGTGFPVVMPDSLPVITEENSCENILDGVVLANAHNAYNEYIENLSGDFLKKYDKQCMTVVENMLKSYRNREYHYTLYYYDQAGSLVRTVPPEGVQALSFTSPSDALYGQLQQDLIDGTHTVLTDHKMATTYSYNSLGQLLRQTTPDHDLMEIWTLALPNGLHKDLEVTALQMLTESTGYLAGKVSEGGKNRGLLYKTTDGGQNWKRVTSLVAPGLLKTFFPKDALGAYLITGYAISSEGALLKSTDAGLSWDLVSLYGTGQVFAFSDLSFETELSGILVCPDGRIVKTTDGAQSFTVENILPLPTQLPGTFLKLKSVAKQSATPAFYTVSISLGSDTVDVIIKEQSGTKTLIPLQARELLSVSAYAPDKAYFGAKDMLLHADFATPSGTEPLIRTVDARVSGYFYDVIFLNKDKGVAKLANPPYLSTGKLIYTADGGKSWQTLLDSLDFVQLNLNQRTAQMLQVLATAYGNQLFELTLTANASQPLIRQLVSGAEAKAAQLDGYIAISSDRVKIGTKYYLSQGLNDGYALNSKAFTNGENAIGWQSHLLPGLQNLPQSPSDRYVKMLSVTFGNTIHTLALTEDNRLHHLSASPAGVFTVELTLASNAAVFGDFCLDKSQLKAYTFNTSDGKFYAYNLISKTLTAVSLSPLASGVGTGGYSLDINASDLIFASKDGYFARIENIAGSPQLRGGRTVFASSVNALCLNSDNKLMAGLNNAKYADYSAGYSSMTIIPVERQTADIHAITAQGKDFYFVGGDGMAYLRKNLSFTIYYPTTHTFNGYLMPTAISYQPGTSIATVFPGKELRHVAVSEGTIYLFDKQGGYFYGTSGALTFKPSQSGTSPSWVQTVPTILPGTPLVLASYANSEMRFFNKASNYENTSLYCPPLTALHFSDVSLGTVAGEGFFARQTQNGTATWAHLKPNGDVLVQAQKNIRKVWTTPQKNAIFVGDNYLGLLKGTQVSYQSFTGDIKDLNFKNRMAKDGYIAYGSAIQKLSYSGQDASFTVTVSGAPVSMGSNTIGALHIFNNDNVITAGENSSVRLYNRFTSTVINLNTDLPASLTLTDIFFHDDYNGYVTGENGVLYRSENVSLHPTTFSIEGMQWKAKPNDHAAGSSGGNYISPDVDISVISFGSRFSGVFAGKKHAGYANAQALTKGYARTLKDETGQYGTNFYYDRLGRIAVSQNARQYAENKYSYKLYDVLGRTYQAGEKTENSGLEPKFSSIFGAEVGGQLMTSVVDDTKLSAWINGSGARKEVTHSYYDNNQLAIAGLPSTQQAILNQRNRIVSVSYEKVYDGNDATYTTATHYSYDIHGNVKTLLQDNPSFASDPLLAAQRFKKLDYTYDLVSGNVHRVDYQQGKVDEWHHAYRYDADNRITDVYTTAHTPVTNPNHGIKAAMDEPLVAPFWQKDAAYTYYKHGPLARTVLGSEKVQGVDYVYTVQGWIKAVNSNTLNADRDPAKDGVSAEVNALVARDVFGYSLHYNDNDYKPIKAGVGDFVASQTGSDVHSSGSQLYNGNIGQMVTTLTHPETRQVLPLGNAYKYDQLNRLVASKSFSNLDLGSNTWGNTGTYDNKYYNAFTYDANGNILTQVRHDSVGTKIDELTYRYQKNFAGRLLKNRLYLVNDAVSSSLYGDDIDDMGTFDNNVNTINTANNYSYDGEGRLTKDRQEEIDTILWRVDGKVSAIRRTAGSSKKNLVFDYDAFGRRTAKHVYTANDELVSSTYYVLDAGGNVMSTYQMDIDDENSSLSMYQNEKYIYGSSRLGMLKDSVNVLGSAYTDTDTTNFSIKLGNKRYELSNHLGNVLSVISDKPISVDENSDNTVDYWQADILSSYDYSPFGVMLSGRTFEKEETEEVCHNETTLTTQTSLDETFDTWFTWTATGSALLTYVDGKLQISNPNNAKKNIGAYKTFTTGTGVHAVSFDITDNSCANVQIWPPALIPVPINVYIKDNANNIVASGSYTTAGTYNLSFTPVSSGLSYKIEFSMTNASAFCYFAVDNVLITYQSEETTQVCENVSKKGSYPYAFQNQERDDEIKGRGNSYNYTYRMHDSRLGRFFAVDPLFKDYPYNSSYAFSENVVINAIELEGLEKVDVNEGLQDESGTIDITTTIAVLKDNVNSITNTNFNLDNLIKNDEDLVSGSNYKLQIIKDDEGMYYALRGNKNYIVNFHVNYVKINSLDELSINKEIQEAVKDQAFVGVLYFGKKVTLGNKSVELRQSKEGVVKGVTFSFNHSDKQYTGILIDDFQYSSGTLMHEIGHGLNLGHRGSYTLYDRHGNWNPMVPFFDHVKIDGEYYNGIGIMARSGKVTNPTYDELIMIMNNNPLKR